MEERPRGEAESGDLRSDAERHDRAADALAQAARRYDAVGAADKAALVFEACRVERVRALQARTRAEAQLLFRRR